MPLEPLNFAKGSHNLAKASHCIRIETLVLESSSRIKRPSFIKGQRFFILRSSGLDDYSEITSREANEGLFKHFITVFPGKRALRFRCSGLRSPHSGWEIRFALTFYRLRTPDDSPLPEDIATSFEQPPYEDAMYHGNEEGESMNEMPASKPGHSTPQAQPQSAQPPSQSTQAIQYVPGIFDPPEYVSDIHQPSQNAPPQPTDPAYWRPEGFPEQGTDGILRLPCAKDTPPQMVHWSLFSIKALDGNIYKTCEPHRRQQKKNRR